MSVWFLGFKFRVTKLVTPTLFDHFYHFLFTFFKNYCSIDIKHASLNTLEIDSGMLSAVELVSTENFPEVLECH